MKMKMRSRCSRCLTLCLVFSFHPRGFVLVGTKTDNNEEPVETHLCVCVCSMRETEATANSCVPTETTTAAETSLMNETCRPDRQHEPTSSNIGDDYDDADQADQYSDVFVEDGAKDLEDHSATDTRELQLSLASVTSEEDDQERHRTAEMWEDGNVEDSTSCGLSPDNDIDDYDVDDAVFDSNSTIVDDQAPMNALLEHTSHVG